ncbi:MAG: hypothetical protein P1U89_10635 [Verrucomicrobiales bacterium]|nr:hypothetical protein [Verrucomicrobiales bacterium]
MKESLVKFVMQNRFIFAVLSILVPLCAIGAELTGTVTDENQRPIPDAKIYIETAAVRVGTSAY